MSRDGWLYIAELHDALARLRDFLAHAYYAVDADELWNICTAHAPADLERLRVLLALQSGDHGSD